MGRWNVLAVLAVVGCSKEDPSPATDAPRSVPVVDTASDTGGLGIVHVVPPEDPGPPDYPDDIRMLTVTVRALGVDPAEGPVASMCLTEERCFELSLPDVNEFEAEQLGVYHFEGVGLDRSAVDRFQLVQPSDSDVSPSCVQVAFDGEPVHCVSTEEGSGSLWDSESVVECARCDAEPITHGPIVGMAKADDTRIWIRTDATRQVSLHVGLTPDEMRLVRWAYPRVVDDFSAEFQLTDLLAATDYFYQIQVDGVPTGETHSFTTAPEDGTPVEMDLSFVSCTSWNDQRAFGEIIDVEPDIIAFLGDNHYGDTLDKGSLLWNYRWAHSRGFRRELMHTTSTLAVWDDHDYLGNNTDSFTPGKVGSRLVFEDYWPNPAHGTDDLPGVFFKTSYGDVDLFFLDGRYYRGEGNNLIGDSQMMWLMEQLVESTATFKLLAIGSQWSLESSVDSWAAFPEARGRLFDFIRDQGIDGVALMSGDVHYSEIRMLSHDGLYDIPEFTSSATATRLKPCRVSEFEQVFCYDEDQSFINLHVDTVSASPSISASIINEYGATVAEHTLWLADLQL